jgi:hypothetical protein
MKLTTTLILILLLFILSGCKSKEADQSPKEQYYYDSMADGTRTKSSAAGNMSTAAEQPEAELDAKPALKQGLFTTIGGREGQFQKVSLDEANTAEENKQAIERKIIRNGRLTIETDSPAEGQSKLNAIAGEFGGYVVTSDYKQNDSRSAASEMLTITIRVPAAQFDAVMAKLRPVGARVINENVTGQDVTEEFIDLEARIKTQKALEQQFLEIMKRATKVEDALQVQTEIANVRTEIERIEGRKRFLENQSALSTITVVLQTPAPIVSSNPNGFWYSIKEAFGDGVDLASGFVLGLIRLVIAGIPVVLFIGLPLYLVCRYLWRQWKAKRESEPLEVKPIPQE